MFQQITTVFFRTCGPEETGNGRSDISLMHWWGPAVAAFVSPESLERSFLEQVSSRSALIDSGTRPGAPRVDRSRAPPVDPLLRPLVWQVVRDFIQDRRMVIPPITGNNSSWWTRMAVSSSGFAASTGLGREVSQPGKIRPPGRLGPPGPLSLREHPSWVSLVLEAFQEIPPGGGRVFPRVPLGG